MRWYTRALGICGFGCWALCLYFYPGLLLVPLGLTLFTLAALMEEE